jgi:tRNA U34 2-thiouridine synthase MnmA/TrmU
MRNWDGRDDEGLAGGECPADREWADVRAVCAGLPGPYHPPPVEVNFVREYWTEVFAPFVAAYASGARTPNPDVACNRFIKVAASHGWGAEPCVVGRRNTVFSYLRGTTRVTTFASGR